MIGLLSDNTLDNGCLCSGCSRGNGKREREKERI